MRCDFKSNRVLPAVYSDEISYYEQIAKICEKINELVKLYNNIEELYVTKEELKNSQDAQDATWKANLEQVYNTLDTYIRSEVKRLEDIIAKAFAGKVTVFDPTYGIAPRPVEQVIKNVYHWLRYYADYASVIDELNFTCKTRDDLSLTAKTFDLFSMLYYSKSEYPQPAPVDQYVRKHDILAYYFERMAQ